MFFTFEMFFLSSINDPNNNKVFIKVCRIKKIKYIYYSPVLYGKFLLGQSDGVSEVLSILCRLFCVVFEVSCECK